MTDGTQSTTERSRDPWAMAFGVCAILLLVGGFLLTFTGVGADLGQERPVIVTLRSTELPREMLGWVKVGDPVYTEPAGAYVGRITKVVEGPMREAFPDRAGILQASPNPVKMQIEVTIEATGRQGKDVTAVGTQVVSVGQRFSVYTPTTFLDGIAVGVDVR